ncbi:histidine phosphatase family protein, partial [Escherichia coli]|uniref:histidine phosphatase family protein n=1 Tax=Escherichia coli TaxID=562 RepID=UPI003078D761
MNDLKNGGYIIYFRHAEATVGQDSDNLVFEDCSTQRNLSDHGKQQAQVVGAFFKENPIPIAYPVIASPYCRTRETAEIAFGKQNIQLNPTLADIV